MSQHNLLSETILSFAQATKAVPGRGGENRISIPTIWRWCSKGIKLPNGKRLHLEAIRLGGHWFTTREAIDRFAEAQTAARLSSPDSGDVKTARIRTPGQRQRANARAAKRLQVAGI